MLKFLFSNKQNMMNPRNKISPSSLEPTSSRFPIELPFFDIELIAYSLVVFKIFLYQCQHDACMDDLGYLSGSTEAARYTCHSSHKPEIPRSKAHVTLIVQSSIVNSNSSTTPVRDNVTLVCTCFMMLRFSLFNCFCFFRKRPKLERLKRT